MDRQDKKRFNAGKVDIISHSMGALVARAYLQEMDLKDGSRVSSLSYEDDVANLVMIAAPHLEALSRIRYPLSWAGTPSAP